MALVSSLAAPRKQCATARYETDAWGPKNGTTRAIYLIDYGYRLYNDILCKLKIQTNA